MVLTTPNSLWTRTLNLPLGIFPLRAVINKLQFDFGHFEQENETIDHIRVSVGRLVF
jgi:hypothetical protein